VEISTAGIVLNKCTSRLVPDCRFCN